VSENDGDLCRRAGGCSPSSPRFTLTRAIGKVGRNPIQPTPAGMLWPIRPARLASRLRFGDALQERKAALRHRANRIDSHSGNVAQAEDTDVGIRAMLVLSVGSAGERSGIKPENTPAPPKSMSKTRGTPRRSAKPTTLDMMK
jgi:hypothetical protein